MVHWMLLSLYFQCFLSTYYVTDKILGGGAPMESKAGCVSAFVEATDVMATLTYNLLSRRGGSGIFPLSHLFVISRADTFF